MNILKIATSPRKEKSASTAIVNAFLSEYREHVGDVTVDTLDTWQEQLPEFDAEQVFFHINAFSRIRSIIARNPAGTCRRPG
jgi:FMN-dependent NADH-azoreductase